MRLLASQADPPAPRATAHAPTAVSLRRPAISGLLAALLLSLSACSRAGGDSRPEAEVPEAERYGGTAVIGSTSDVADMSPLTWNVQNAQYLQMYVLFMPLVRYDERFRPEPWLAESWEVNADTTLLTFHLRHDVYWQDGVKTTARDVKFSYDLAREPRTGFIYSSFWAHYGDAEAPDSFTFRVRMTPHAEFLDAWRSFAPVPEHVLKGVAPGGRARPPVRHAQPGGQRARSASSRGCRGRAGPSRRTSASRPRWAGGPTWTGWCTGWCRSPPRCSRSCSPGGWTSTRRCRRSRPRRWGPRRGRAWWITGTARSSTSSGTSGAGRSATRGCGAR